MVYDHLVCRVHVFVAVDVVCGIKRTTIVMAQLCGQRCSECCSVSGCQTLCLYAPQGHRLDSTSVKSKSDLQVGDFEGSELELALSGFGKALFQHRDAAASGGLMVNAQVPHHRGHLWFVWLQDVFQSPVHVDLCTCANDVQCREIGPMWAGHANVLAHRGLLA